jgi:hypothetical protein
VQRGFPYFLRLGKNRIACPSTAAFGYRNSMVCTSLFCSLFFYPSLSLPRTLLLYAGPFQPVLFLTNTFSHNTFSHNSKEKFSMNPTTIRIIAGVLFVIFVTIIVWRRKNMASKRRHVL